MNYSTEQAVDFLGHQINCVQDADGTPYVPLKCLCEILGIDHNRQRRKIKDNGLFNRKTVCVKGADGRHRNMLCLPLERIRDWASTINPSTVRIEVVEALTELLDESDEALEGREAQEAKANPGMIEVTPEARKKEQVYNCLGNLNWFLDGFLLWASEIADNNGDYFPGDEEIIKASPEEVREYVRKVRCNIRVVQAIIDASIYYENLDNPLDEHEIIDFYNESLKLYRSTEELVYGEGSGSGNSEHSYMDYLCGPTLNSMAEFGVEFFTDFQQRIIPRKKG
jgi:hypothetical protein